MLTVSLQVILRGLKGGTGGQGDEMRRQKEVARLGRTVWDGALQTHSTCVETCLPFWVPVKGRAEGWGLSLRRQDSVSYSLSTHEVLEKNEGCAEQMRY